MKLLLCLMTLVFAFSGMLYEYILAHLISGTLGGAYTILFVTFCVFAASLGFGTIIYNYIPNKFKSLKFLAVVQVFIAVVVAFLPTYFEILNHIFLNLNGSYIEVLLLSAMPVVLLGMITGFELPLMFLLSGVSISKILFWDYLGMFLAVILFPLIFALELQVVQVIYSLSFLAIVMAVLSLLLHFKIKSPSYSESKQMPFAKTQSLPKAKFGLAIFLVFIMSFCSFAYQGLIGKSIVAILGDHYAVRSYAIGFFILGMALGAFLTESFAKSNTQAIKKLIKVEILLCGLAALAPIILYLVGGYIFMALGLLKPSNTQLIWGGSVFLSLISLLVGVFSGMEMPLVFQWLGLNHEDRPSYFLIASNYVAAIFSGILVGFILPQYIGYSFSFLIIIAVNILILLSIYLYFTEFKRQTLGALVVILVFAAINAKYVLPSRQFLIGASYAQMELSSWGLKSLKNTLKAINYMGEAFRIESFYQNIDLVTTEDNKVEGQERLFYLFLNRQPQFTSNSIDGYHKSIAWASKSFSVHPPKEILVLGGGDGLLAKELLNFYPDTPITLIELDGAMIELAKTNSRFLQFNQDSLSHENINIIVGDAYQYLRKSSKQYDLILVDFPYPTSVDLGRLYSKELYVGLRSTLTEHGVAIIDAPILIHYRHLKRIGLDPNVSKIFSTLYYSGFKTPFAFGPFDPFIAVAKDNRELTLTEEVLAQTENQVYINLHSLEHDLFDLVIDESLVNTVLQPTIIGM